MYGTVGSFQEEGWTTTSLKVPDHFYMYLADETMMKHFDQFRDQVNMPPEEVLLQPNHLLREWMKAEEVPAKVVSFSHRK